MNCMFASDNTACVDPKILEAMVNVNNGYVKPYGFDDSTAQAEDALKKVFGNDIESHFVISGTAGNVLALKSFLRRTDATICTDIAHINTDECGAVEASTGTRLLTVPAINGKLTPAGLDNFLFDINNVHRAKPAMVSITQSTEQGTVYSIDEIKAITKKAHDNGLCVHMDGSRIANAVAALNVSCKAMTVDAGVDVLSFGAAKNGAMFGEAIIYFKKGFTEDFFRMKKQAFQHISKQRFMNVQMLAYLENDLWIENAKNANAMALYLASELEKIDCIKISRKTEVNAVFATMTKKLIADLHEDYYFYVVNPAIDEVRLMCSFAMQKEDIDAFINKIKSCL